MVAVVAMAAGRGAGRTALIDYVVDGAARGYLIVDDEVATMSVNVKLPPALETFARERVESGEYESVSDVLVEGVRALERRHVARTDFTKSLIEAEEEAERDGWIPLDDVLAEMEAVVTEVERTANRR